MAFTLQSLYSKNIRPSVLSDKAWFHLSGYINEQNVCICSSENPHEYRVTLLHPQKIGVWCTTSWFRIIKPFVYCNGNSWMLSQNHVQYCITAVWIETTLLLSARQSVHPFSTINGGSTECIFWRSFDFQRLVVSKGFRLDAAWFFLWSSLKNWVFLAEPAEIEEFKSRITQEIRSIDDPTTHI